jgi:hypothetical protein
MARNISSIIEDVRCRQLSGSTPSDGPCLPPTAVIVAGPRMAAEVPSWCSDHEIGDWEVFESVHGDKIR